MAEVRTSSDKAQNVGYVGPQSRGCGVRPRRLDPPQKTNALHASQRHLRCLGTVDVEGTDVGAGHSADVFSYKGVSLIEPRHDAGDVENGEVVGAGLFIASSNRTTALEGMEAAFHHVAKPIELLVEPGLHVVGGVRRNDRLHSSRTDGMADFRRAVTRVGDGGLAGGVLDRLLGLGRLVSVSLGQGDVERPALRRGDRMDLARNIFSRAAQMIASDPPFPQAASWCARTIVASRREPASSTSMASSSKIRFQMPRFGHLSNRLYTVFQAPNLSGRSRQGTLVRTRQMTALTKSRSPRLERGPARTGRIPSTRSHSASLSSCRLTVSVDCTQRHPAIRSETPQFRPHFGMFPKSRV